MKMKRKLWALLLSVALILTCMPVMAFADEAAGAAEPVSAEYVGARLRGVVGTNRILSLEDPAPAGNRFDVTFSNGSVKEFKWPESDEEVAEGLEGAFIYDNDTYLFAELNDDGAEPISFAEGRNENVELRLTVHYLKDGEDEIASLPVPTVVDCTYDNMPLAIKFVPADGFEAECAAGPNFLTEEVFYGPGNKFEVTYEGWDDSQGTYIVFKRSFEYYNLGTDEDGNVREGFALNGNPERYGDFYLDEGEYIEPSFGDEFDAEFSYTEYIPELDKYITVDFTAPVKVTKYAPYANWPVYAYTGKVRTPKFKVYDNDDNLIDSTEYEVTCDPQSKMGWYDAVITFKDAEKYGDPITGYYGIAPAAPKLTKLVAGKKSLTVKWKKLTAKQLKNVDGFYIELSTDKHFLNNYKSVKISKKQIKSGKKLVKNLKKGKKYYVRMYAYKKISKAGDIMFSNDSKVLTKKTKK